MKQIGLITLCLFIMIALFFFGVCLLNAVVDKQITKIETHRHTIETYIKEKGKTSLYNTVTYIKIYHDNKLIKEYME